MSLTRILATPRSFRRKSRKTFAYMLRSARLVAQVSLHSSLVPSRRRRSAGTTRWYRGHGNPFEDELRASDGAYFASANRQLHTLAALLRAI